MMEACIFLGEHDQIGNAVVRHRASGDNLTKPQAMLFAAKKWPTLRIDSWTRTTQLHVQRSIDVSPDGGELSQASPG